MYPLHGMVTAEDTTHGSNNTIMEQEPAIALLIWYVNLTGPSYLDRTFMGSSHQRTVLSPSDSASRFVTRESRSYGSGSNHHVKINPAEIFSLFSRIMGTRTKILFSTLSVWAIWYHNWMYRVNRAIKLGPCLEFQMNSIGIPNEIFQSTHKSHTTGRNAQVRQLRCCICQTPPPKNINMLIWIFSCSVPMLDIHFSVSIYAR